MPVRVIDASALAALVFNEPDADRVLGDIARGSLAAPHLIATELASVCLKKIRAHPADRAAYIAAFDLLNQMNIELMPISLDEAIALAEATNLSIYDACYLWLALSLKCELLTLDKKLASVSLH